MNCGGDIVVIFKNPLVLDGWLILGVIELIAMFMFGLAWLLNTMELPFTASLCFMKILAIVPVVCLLLGIVGIIMIRFIVIIKCSTCGIVRFKTIQFRFW